MIWWGWKVEPKAVIDIDIKELHAECKKHKIPMQLVVGEKTDSVYFIPIIKQKRAFYLCPKCDSKFEEPDEIFQKPLIAFYDNNMTITEFRKSIGDVLAQEKRIAKKISEKDDENFKSFLKYLPIIILFFVFLIVLKFILK